MFENPFGASKASKVEQEVSTQEKDVVEGETELGVEGELDGMESGVEGVEDSVEHVQEFLAEVPSEVKQEIANNPSAKKKLMRLMLIPLLAGGLGMADGVEAADRIDLSNMTQLAQQVDGGNSEMKKIIHVKVQRSMSSAQSNADFHNSYDTAIAGMQAGGMSFDDAHETIYGGQ